MIPGSREFSKNQAKKLKEAWAHYSIQTRILAKKIKLYQLTKIKVEIHRVISKIELKAIKEIGRAMWSVSNKIILNKL